MRINLAATELGFSEIARTEQGIETQSEMIVFEISDVGLGRRFRSESARPALLLVFDVSDQPVHRARAVIAAQPARALGVAQAERLENCEMLQFGLFHFTGKV